VGKDPEKGAAIEDLVIVAGMREHDDLNVYSVLYTLIHLVVLNTLYYQAGGMTFFNQLAHSFISCTSVEWPKFGYVLKNIPGSPDSLASFTPTALSSSLDCFPSDSGTNGSSSPCPQKMGATVAGEGRSCRNDVKPLNHQNETVHAYPFDLFPDGEPPTQNSQTSELELGGESSSQSHGRSLTESPDNNPIRGETLIDLLRDKLVHLIP